MEKLLLTSWTCSISINLPATFALAVNIFFKNRSVTALGATCLSPLQPHAYGISYPFISEPLKPFYPSRNLSKLTSCQQHFLNCFLYNFFFSCLLVLLSFLSKRPEHHFLVDMCALQDIIIIRCSSYSAKHLLLLFVFWFLFSFCFFFLFFFGRYIVYKNTYLQTSHELVTWHVLRT